jgi:aspartate-semialdehyde dehydrogenase
MPSLRLLQAPVMHGYSISVWVELGQSLTEHEIEDALAGSLLDVRRAGMEAPTVVDFAGQSGMAAGQIRRDRANPRAWWFWLVADNLRVLAEDALAVARDALLRGSLL